MGLPEIQKKLFWWDEAEPISQARLIARVMTHGTWEDILEVEAELGREIFLEVLRDTPAATFDSRSLGFWRKRLGLGTWPKPRAGGTPWPPR